MKAALIHDFLTQLGGAERVLDVLHEIYPDAPVYTLLYDEKKTEKRYKNWRIKTSFLQNLPARAFSYKWYLPLMKRAIESFDLSGYNLVISDASAFAKGVKVAEGTIHICYCHTPTRYLWQDRREYVKSLPYPSFVKIALKPLLASLQKWDYKAAQKIDFFIANSKEVKKRIKEFYQRDSKVIYPPVNTDFFKPDPNIKPDNKKYYFTAGRLEPYKKFDLVVEAFNVLNLPLKIAGTGSQAETLKRIAKDNIEFLGRVTDDELKRLYQTSKAFIFPALEDAGMMVVEAVSCGTPVIAYGAGGALEFITSGIHGEFFMQQTTDQLIDVVNKFNPARYDLSQLIAQASKFNKTRFKTDLLSTVQNVLNGLRAKS